MIKELSSYDQNDTGLISESQLSVVVMNFQLPLKVSTLKMLFEKFAGKCLARDLFTLRT